MTNTLTALRSVAVLVVHPDGRGTVDIDGRVHSLTQEDETAARHAALQLVIAHSQHTGREVLVSASDQHAEHRLLVDPDGTVRPAPHTVRVLVDCPLSEPVPSRTVSRGWWLMCGLTLVGLTVAAAAMLSRDPVLPDAGAVAVAPAIRVEPRVHVAAGPAAAAELPSRPRWAASPVKGWPLAAGWQARRDAVAAARQTAAPRFVPAQVSPAVRPQYQPAEPVPERPAAGWGIPGNPAMPPGPYSPQTSP
ncbi:MAG: hypothetical protein U0R23_12360 [Candidatus Nanopelagicales bacterium]